MNIRPILSAMLRNKIGALLVALQTAVTLAVVVNAIFIVQNRVAYVNRDNGMDLENMFAIQNWGFKETYNHHATVREDIELIGNIRGVIAVTPSNALPLSNGGSAGSFSPSTDDDAIDVPANYYYVTEQSLDTLGVELVAGRGFNAEEIEFRADGFSAEFSKVALITKALADKIFGEDSDAIGKLFYTGTGQSAEVIGVIRQMHGSWVSWDGLNNVMLLPVVENGPFVRYMVRVEPGELTRVMEEAEKLLVASNDGRMIRRVMSMAEVAAVSYKGDTAMAIFLSVVVVLLLTVTALGIIGLASFTVRQRTKQIGTRRAVGARRRDILSYFLTENWLMMTIGVALGSVLAVTLNYFLATEFELEKLNMVYLPAGIMAMWLLGLLAVIAPARRASRISPAIATRTV